MKSLFTVHAGEVLVGSQIEQRFKSAELWLPAKDTGVDLLVTNGKRGLAVSLQVKFSHDFLVAHMQSIYQEGLLACGWWKHSRKKILASKADLWVFALQAFDPKKTQYVLIPPRSFITACLQFTGGPIACTRICGSRSRASAGRHATCRSETRS